ncbi:MAG: hypothetical protein ACK535_08700 [Cyanobacteriota bacterium]
MIMPKAAACYFKPPSDPNTPGAPADSETPPAAPELTARLHDCTTARLRPWPGLDHLGAIPAGGGLILGLIALLTT